MILAGMVLYLVIGGAAGLAAILLVVLICVGANRSKYNIIRNEKFENLVKWHKGTGKKKIIYFINCEFDGNTVLRGEGMYYIKNCVFHGTLSVNKGGIRYIGNENVFNDRIITNFLGQGAIHVGNGVINEYGSLTGGINMGRYTGRVQVGPNGTLFDENGRKLVKRGSEWYTQDGLLVC